MNNIQLVFFLSSLCTQIYGQDKIQHRNFKHAKCFNTIKECTIKNKGIIKSEEDPFRYELTYCIGNYFKKRLKNERKK